MTTEQLHCKNWGAEHSGDAEEEYDGQGRRRQQQKPERRKVPAAQHSGSQVHHISPEEKPGSKKGHQHLQSGCCRSDGTQDGSKFIIITLDTRWREETWRCPEGV